jgi:flagellar biosynthesis protein FliQ
MPAGAVAGLIAVSVFQRQINQNRLSFLPQALRLLKRVTFWLGFFIVSSEEVFFIGSPSPAGSTV